MNSKSNSTANKGNLKFSFFRACANAQEVAVNLPRALIHDNRLDVIPSRARAGFDIAVAGSTLSEWYEEFLRYKFLYFCLLLKHPDGADEKIRAAVRDKASDLEDVLHLWAGQAERARQAYLYRVTQLPEEIVHTSWYNELEEFREWSALCREQFNNRRREIENLDIENAYHQLQDKFQQPIQPSFEDSQVIWWIEERILKGLGERTEATLSHLLNRGGQQLPGGWLREMFESEPTREPLAFALSPPAQRIYEELSLRFLSHLAQGIFSKEAFLQHFLELLKREAQCDLSDFMEVIRGGERIRLLTTSVEIDDQVLREDLGEEEAYDKGEGITGSILLLPKPGPWFHAGSDDIEKDPRQSPWHVNKYEPVYGELYNFWAFPVVRDKRLIGAFRVVNRLNETGKVQFSGWPLVARFQLCEIARSFSKIWEVVSSLEPGRELWRTGWQATQRELVKDLELSWVSEYFLSDLVRHLQAVTHRKIEKQSFGCCIGIVKQAETERIQRVLPSYLGLVVTDSIEEPSEAARYYNRVTPTGGAFFFNGQGEFLKVLRLQYRDQQSRRMLEGFEAIRAITNDYNALLLLVERDHHSILFFHGGGLVGEYYLSERTGNWKMRHYNRVLRDVEHALDEVSGSERKLSYRVLQMIYKEAWNLSYRKYGALIIVADPRKLEGLFEYTFGFETDLPIEEVSGSTLFLEMAGQDGATVVTPEGIVVGANAMFKEAKEDIQTTPTLDRLTRDRGGRHRLGAVVASALPDALVIIVSENRGISILYNGSEIVWDW